MAKAKESVEKGDQVFYYPGAAMNSGELAFVQKAYDDGRVDCTMLRMGYTDMCHVRGVMHFSDKENYGSEYFKNTGVWESKAEGQARLRKRKKEEQERIEMNAKAREAAQNAVAHRKRIQEMLLDGKTASQIAKDCGTTAQHVAEIHSQIEQVM